MINDFNKLRICVFTPSKPNILWFRGQFLNSYVHNLFIDLIFGDNFWITSADKKGRIFSSPFNVRIVQCDLGSKNYFTAPFNRLPALNFATRVAGILISFPV